MENLPLYIPLVFILTLLLSVGIFYRATHRSYTTFTVILTWVVLQSFISLRGFYSISKGFPPRFPLLVVPPVILIVSLFISARGRVFIDSLDIKYLTLLHTVRILVELVLFWLCSYKMVPQLITFEGRNFDILSGLSAPLIYYFGFINIKLNKTIIIIWNFVCLALLTNVVISAVLSAPTPFQQFAFDQPNVAILHFPFVLLPSCVVPLVLFSHLAAIRKLWLQKRNLT